jgi:hypothetical protein
MKIPVFFLDRFLRGIRKKAINRYDFGGSWLMALKRGSKGVQPFETLFFFYRISL